MSKEKICVYSCITGDYDNVLEIEREEGIDYYLFTNNKKIKSNSWKVIYIEDDSLSNVLLARKTKILGHPIVNDNYDIALWMDGAVSFNTKIKDFIDHFMKNDDVFVAFRHGERNSIKEECEACVRFCKEDKNKVKNILDFYKKEGYPDNNGLIESTVFIKRVKDKKVNETMNLWFDMVKNFTKRDQLSFNYCIYKTDLKVKWINEKVFDNKWFTWHNHRNIDFIKKYRVYFGNESNGYDIDFDVQGDYNIKGNTYSFKEKVLNTTDYIYTSLVPCVEFSNIKIKNVNKDEYDLVNYVNYKNKNIFYNSNYGIKIKKKLYKGDILEFSIDMRVLVENEKLNLIDYLGYVNNSLEEEIKNKKDLEKHCEKLENEISSMINSRSWKITKPIRIITNMLKR